MGRLPRGLRRDDGVAAILICVFVVFLVVPVAGISVDLSSAYANRRQMQNAADAAAQAGAQVMEEVRQGAAAASSLDTTVMNVAAANGSDTSGIGYSCNVVKVVYGATPAVTEGPACSSWTGDAVTYNAVTVHTAHSVSTFFAGAITSGGATSTSASASATAAIQKVTVPEDFGDSIFAMCAYAPTSNNNGNGGASVGSTWVPLLVTVNGQYELNTGQVSGTPTAVGQRYVVWSNGIGNSNLSGCGLGPFFSGLICGLAVPACGQPITLPNWLSAVQGDHVGPTLATMAGYPGCNPSTFYNLNGPTTFSPCAMVVPVCDKSNDVNSSNASNAELYCDAFGEFLLSPGDQTNTSTCTFITGSSKTICGELLGAPEPVDGTPSSDPPGANDPVRIALVQ